MPDPSISSAPASIHPSIDRRDIADTLDAACAELPRQLVTPSSPDDIDSTAQACAHASNPCVGTLAPREYAAQRKPSDIGALQAFQSIDKISSLPESGLDPEAEQANSSTAHRLDPSAASYQSSTLLPGSRMLAPTDSIPRQTIMKALASRKSKAALKPISVASPSLDLMSPANVASRPGSASPQILSAALSDLQSTSPKAHPANSIRPSQLLSPCFFHQRFDDAVNIDKVLEEIADDEWLSHSRLMQTATGVREVSKQLQRRPIKRAVRNVMIVTKARDNQLVTLTRELATWLLSAPRYGADLGVNVYVDAKLGHSKRFDAAGLLAREPRFQQMLRFWTPELCWNSPDKFDLVLTLGGDGTVLFTSWLFQRIVPPILSFSLGSLGFLTNFQFNEYKEHLDRVMGDAGMRVNLRMRFTCTVYRHSAEGHTQEDEQFEVLNELVIDRGPSPYVSNLELFGDNDLLTVVQADGCIFSTPTGKQCSGFDSTIC